MKFSSIGRSNVRAVCGGVVRVGAVIGEAVRGEALSWPMAANERLLLERRGVSVSSLVKSPRSAAIEGTDGVVAKIEGRGKKKK